MQYLWKINTNNTFENDVFSCFTKDDDNSELNSMH